MLRLRNVHAALINLFYVAIAKMNFVYLPGIFLLISCSESMAGIAINFRKRKNNIIVHVQLIVKINTAFLVSPSSYNASEGSNITFHCHINETGNILFWLVNDEFSHSSAHQNRSISLIKYNNERSILTIQANSWNDHVEIQCAYRSKQSRSLNCSNEMVMCSKKAILRVQGYILLMHFTVTIQCHTIILVVISHSCRHMLVCLFFLI
jgi:hypothetical protein